MISYLQGRVIDFTSETSLVVGVGDFGSRSVVGYEVNIPSLHKVLPNLMEGDPIELHIYSHIREDRMDFYGFTNRSSKMLYLTLINVNGIGPKMALAIMSAINTQELISAVMNEEIEILKAIPGVGKKTAERIILELKDPLKKRMESQDIEQSVRTKNPVNRIILDAAAALVGLGYRESDVMKCLATINDQEKSETVESLVRLALREMSGVNLGNGGHA